MDITSFDPARVPEAADLFLDDFQRLRAALPILPAADRDAIAGRLSHLFAQCPGVMAVDQGRLAGYMGWYVLDQFRDTDRTAAYCPEWAHAVRPEGKRAITNALYRAAAAQWTGCQAHALTLLARDVEAEKTWFWNGFGLMVVDAIRPITPSGKPAPEGIRIRQAQPDDQAALAVLEAEHWQHYTQPPVLMAAQEFTSAAGLIRDPVGSVWLAERDGTPLAYIQFEGSGFGAADVVGSRTTIAITGAYTRPAYRGLGAASALLDAGLRHYADRGFERCSVDFESFNPEAAAFWLRTFEPVCLSMIRVPEAG